ncbi:NAD(P)/FAD-dependent oxidoreductase [Chitinophaga sp.]|uniref:FAD-dependent oxidoreductase n=1 Tax=Chitinophaga sp. TaxID=1869181 RepID=UPI002F954874
MLLENKKIAIVGGGPGGLTLARLLQLKGVAVKVYERDTNKAARIQGATLDLHYASGLKAIKTAGLLKAFKDNYRPGAEKGRVIDKHGNILFDEHAEVTTEDFDAEHFRPEIDRDALRNILLDALQPDTVVWDSQFVTMSPIGDAWKLEFKNGTTATADIVIGAEGANSNIRSFVTPVKPFYAGVVIVQGNVPDAATTIPDMHHLLQGGKIYAYGNERYLHVSSKGDGSIDFYMSSKKDENWWQNSGIDFSDRDQVCSWFKNEFPDWDQIWLSLVEHANLPLYLRPQYCMPLDKGWDTLFNLTLLGDAAHIMPPSGEGVNLAMLDALELSEYLTNGEFKDTQAAIASYEKEMQHRAASEARDAMDMTEWMHAEDAQTKFLQFFGSNT